MISVNSENEQATILNLTETELEGIYGGWRGYEEGFNDRGDERFGFRGDNERRFSFRGDDRGFGFRSDESFGFRGHHW